MNDFYDMGASAAVLYFGQLAVLHSESSTCHVALLESNIGSRPM